MTTIISKRKSRFQSAMEIVYLVIHFHKQTLGMIASLACRYTIYYFFNLCPFSRFNELVYNWYFYGNEKYSPCFCLVLILADFSLILFKDFLACCIFLSAVIYNYTGCRLYQIYGQLYISDNTST